MSAPFNLIEKGTQKNRLAVDRCQGSSACGHSPFQIRGLGLDFVPPISGLWPKPAWPASDRQCQVVAIDRLINLLGQELFCIQRGHASHSGRRYRLTVNLIDQVTRGEHAR